MSERFTTIEMQSPELKFASGHFTIFSATERETLHGHNYHVHANFSFPIGENGINFDYRYYREKLKHLCKSLHLKTLLPERSPHLQIEPADDYYHVYFADDKMIFLTKDVTIVPLRNVTIEELAHWFLEHLCADTDTLKQHDIHRITLKVFNGPGQAGSASWQK